MRHSEHDFYNLSSTRDSYTGFTETKENHSRFMEKENRLEWDHTASIIRTVEYMEARFREHHQRSLNIWFGFHKENDNDVELWIRKNDVFCDAYTTACGAVAYLKCISIDKSKRVCFSFVMFKFRLASMKEAMITVPRLELQAAVLAVRLKLAISDQLEFPVSTVRLWSGFTNNYKINSY